MGGLDTLALQALEDRRQALAEEAVARQYERRPALRQRYGEVGRAKCVQDTAYHLAHLTGALAADSPALFDDYLLWARDLLAARGVGPEDVAENLACLRDVVAERLP